MSSLVFVVYLAWDFFPLCQTENMSKYVRSFFKLFWQIFARRT